jgi:hypothetical protein
MPADDPPAAPPPRPPAWLDDGALRAMEMLRESALTWGRDAMAAAEAVRALAVALHPGLPAPMIEEAVAAVMPDPLSAPARREPGAAGAELAPAAPEEVAMALAYALRFSEAGKPRRTGHEFLAPLAAAQLVAHLERCRFVVMRLAPDYRHGGPAT